jgi:hypothetical protein
MSQNNNVKVKTSNYSWGKMVTVHHGSDTSYPLHPEHQAAIKKLKPGESTSFTDETNRKVTASREGDMVHLSGRGSNNKTPVAYSHFTESMNTFSSFRSDLQEKTLTPAEKKKREEVAKAIERENPKMPMGMKMAIATKTAKRVAEEVDDEGKMAKGQLMRMVNQASALAQMMEDDKQLDGWVQSKLTMASDYLDSVHDYLMHNKQDVDENPEESDLEEATSKEIKMAAGIANDKRYAGGNMTGAVNTIEKIRKNLSQHPKVKQALKRANEDVEKEDTHLCAKHVRSAILGDGVVLEAQHADPDENGQIEWYMVEFKDGIRKVFTEDLEIMLAEYHGNHKKKKRMKDG